MSIVPIGKTEKNPQHLLYHFPSMHPVQFQKMSRDYHYWKEVSAAESVARISGKLLVPSKCLHWERKERFRNRMLRIQRTNYYVLSRSEMTAIEIEKYEWEVQEGGRSASSTRTGTEGVPTYQ